MIKKLLGIAMLATFSLSAMAHEIGAKVYSNANKYRITGVNLVTNGDFSDQLNGWTAVDATVDKLTTFTVGEGTGFGGANEIVVNEGHSALTDGIYQTVTLEQGGTYIVSMKVMNPNGTCFTDFDLTGASINYINAYYNTDGALATVGGDKNVNLIYGENGVSGGYNFTISNEEFTEVNFPVVAPAEGFIVIDLRGLSAGLEICDVTCQAAKKIYDTRIPAKRIAYINTVLNGYDFSDRDTYVDLADEIETLEQMIEDEEEDGFETEMSNLEGYWNDFVEECFSNVLNTIDSGKGTGGNYSANWMNWTAKYNKCSSEDKSSPWSWNCDRWAHKTASANSPLQVQWMRGYAFNNWDPQARLKTTLKQGTYYLGLSGIGGMMTLNKDRWARSTALECVRIEMALEDSENAENNVVLFNNYLSPAMYSDHIASFVVEEEEKEVTILLHCYQEDCISATPGIDVNLINPFLYKVLEAGQLTPEQEAYLEKVNVQMNAFKDAIANAENLASAENTAQPWGKEALNAQITEAKKRYEYFEGLKQSEILKTFEDEKASYTATAGADYEEAKAAAEEAGTTDFVGKVYEYKSNALPDLVMNAGVRFINNYGANPFKTLNAPLTDLVVAIKAANDVLNNPLYNSGDAATFSAVITNAQNTYDESVVAERSDEIVEKLNNAKEQLGPATTAYINSVTKDYIIDIDFSKQPTEIPPVNEGDNPTYSIDGEKGSIHVLGAFSTEMQVEYTASPKYALGCYNTNSDVLYMGLGDAEVDLGYEVKQGDVLTVSFDMYFGYLMDQLMGYILKDAAGNEIGKLLFSANNSTKKPMQNTLGIDTSKFSSVGGKNNGNPQGVICSENNKTHFDIYLNYADNNIKVETSYKNGAVVAHPEVAMPAEVGSLSKIVFNSTMANSERAGWLDNIKVSVIHDVPSGINEVAPATSKVAKAIKVIENGQIVIKKGGKKYSVSAMELK